MESATGPAGPALKAAVPYGKPSKFFQLCPDRSPLSFYLPPAEGLLWIRSCRWLRGCPDGFARRGLGPASAPANGHGNLSGSGGGQALYDRLFHHPDRRRTPSALAHLSGHRTGRDDRPRRSHPSSPFPAPGTPALLGQQGDNRPAAGDHRCSPPFCVHSSSSMVDSSFDHRLRRGNSRLRSTIPLAGGVYPEKKAEVNSLNLVKKKTRSFTDHMNKA